MCLYASRIRRKTPSRGRDGTASSSAPSTPRATSTAPVSSTGYDCQPHNVMVDRETLVPKNIDFALTGLADEMDPSEFETLRFRYRNPQAISDGMVSKLKWTVVDFDVPEVWYGLTQLGTDGLGMSSA